MSDSCERAPIVILATACRVGELMSARWEQIDEEARTMYLPDTKNQRDHTVHLSKSSSAPNSVTVAIFPC